MKKVLFIHHSTGGNLLKEGNVRDELKKLGPDIELWDHSYNLYKIAPLLLAQYTHHTGLCDNAGKITGKDFNIVLSNNSPKEYAEIFSRSLHDPTLKSILIFDIIAFKNCYPTTRIASEDQLAQDKHYYEIIREHIRKYPSKHFIVFTPPPERKERTTIANAARAKRLANWLYSDEFSQRIPNIHVFNFFGHLADENGFLKGGYTRHLPFDSHPNKQANQIVGKLFAQCLAKAASLNSPSESSGHIVA